MAGRRLTMDALLTVASPECRRGSCAWLQINGVGAILGFLLTPF